MLGESPQVRCPSGQHPEQEAEQPLPSGSSSSLCPHVRHSLVSLPYSLARLESVHVCHSSCPVRVWGSTINPGEGWCLVCGVQRGWRACFLVRVLSPQEHGLRRVFRKPSGFVFPRLPMTVPSTPLSSVLEPARHCRSSSFSLNQRLFSAH